jgi:hypothetical protein
LRIFAKLLISKQELCIHAARRVCENRSAGNPLSAFGEALLVNHG